MLRTQTLENGLRLTKLRVPLGVVLIVYEARPNVTVDAAMLCLKSGNACILRGSRLAEHTNRALADLMRETLSAAGLPADAVQLLRHRPRRARTVCWPIPPRPTSSSPAAARS